MSIGGIVRSGMRFNLRRPSPSTVEADDLLAQVAGFFGALESAGGEGVLVGGVALRAWVDGRNTEDLDLIVAVEDAARVAGLAIRERDGDFALASFGALRVDLLFTSNPLFARVAREHSTAVAFVERTVRTADVHGLFLLKLYALPSLHRQMQWPKVKTYEADLAALIHAHHPDTAAILDELAPFMPSTDLTELRRLVADLEQPRARFGS